MNRKIFPTTVFGIIILMGGCVSLKIQPPPEPENQVDAVVMCKGIVQSEGLLFPGESLTEFKPGDGSIHCFIRLKNVSRTIRLKWKWYAPEGRLYRESKEVTVNKNPVYLEVVTAYDQIELKAEEYNEGRWTVAVVVNGQLVGRRTFRLVEN